MVWSQAARTRGRSRRYSDHDIAMLRRIQELTTEGVSLAGVQRILALEDELAGARERMARLEARVEAMRREMEERVEAAHRAVLGQFGLVDHVLVPARKIHRTGGENGCFGHAADRTAAARRTAANIARGGRGAPVRARERRGRGAPGRMRGRVGAHGGGT